MQRPLIGKIGTTHVSIKGLPPPAQRMYTAPGGGKHKVAAASIPGMCVTHVKARSGSTCMSLNFHAVLPPKPAGEPMWPAAWQKQCTCTSCQRCWSCQGRRNARYLGAWPIDATHLATAATNQVQDQGHMVTVLLPSSPGLEPLEREVFGCNKQRLKRGERACRLCYMTSADQCSAFVNHLARLDPIVQMTG